jgi:alpha-mannosidase
MDLRPFTFELGVRAHFGAWQFSKITQAAYNFNFPLVLPETMTSQDFGESVPQLPVALDPLMATHSQAFARVDGGNILLTVLKPCEWCGPDAHELRPDAQWAWNRSFILRAVESCGTDGDAWIQFNVCGVQRVEEVDLLEKETLGEFFLAENAFQVHFMPFEIKTFRLWIW